MHAIQAESIRLRWFSVSRYRLARTALSLIRSFCMESFPSFKSCPTSSILGHGWACLLAYFRESQSRNMHYPATRFAHGRLPLLTPSRHTVGLVQMDITSWILLQLTQKLPLGGSFEPMCSTRGQEKGKDSTCLRHGGMFEAKGNILITPDNPPRSGQKLRYDQLRVNRLPKVLDI